MALPDYFSWEPGTALKFVAIGGDATFTLTSLANGSARMSASLDLGANYEQVFLMRIVAEMASAPTAGTSIEAYAAYGTGASTGFPAEVSGSDGAWPADGNEDEWVKQLGIPTAWLITTNDATQQEGPWFEFVPKLRYMTVVVDNNTGVALSSTAANNYVEIVPRNLVVQDAAP